MVKGEIFGSAAAQDEAGAFGEKQRGIDIGSGAERFYLMRNDAKSTHEEGALLAILGIDAQNVNPVWMECARSRCRKRKAPMPTEQRCLSEA